jgi:hypothetical protein
MATFSDASETMLQEMNQQLNSTMGSVASGDQSNAAAAAAAAAASAAMAASHQSNVQLVSIPKFEFKRPISCYFFDFEARFFNSKRISSAFVDLLRATYVFSDCFFCCN